MNQFNDIDLCEIYYFYSFLSIAKKYWYNTKHKVKPKAEHRNLLKGGRTPVARLWAVRASQVGRSRCKDTRLKKGDPVLATQDTYSWMNQELADPKDPKALCEGGAFNSCFFLPRRAGNQPRIVSAITVTHPEHGFHRGEWCLELVLLKCFFPQTSLEGMKTVKRHFLIILSDKHPIQISRYA